MLCMPAKLRVSSPMAIRVLRNLHATSSTYQNSNALLPSQPKWLHYTNSTVLSKHWTTWTLGHNLKHLPTKPANMPDSKPKPNLELSDGLYRLDHADSDLFMSRPVRKPSVATLGDYYEQLRQVGQQSDKSNESDKSDNPNYQHPCYRNPLRTCNCANKCADSDFDNGDNGNAFNLSTKLAIYRTGDNNAPINDSTEQFKFTTTQGKSTVSGWPCVVVGHYEQTKVNTIQSISITGIQSSNTIGNTDSKSSTYGYVSNTTIETKTP